MRNAMQRYRDVSRAGSFVIMVCAMVAMAVFAVNTASARVGSGGAENLENAIRDAAVACYSTEGRYPESLDYLIDNYGLRPDRRYDVHYEIIGANLPPDIVVTQKGGR